MAYKYFCQMPKVLGCLVWPCFPARVWQWEVLGAVAWGRLSFSSCSTGKSSGKPSAISHLLERDIPTSIHFPWDSTFKWLGLCCRKRAEWLAWILTPQLNFMLSLPRHSMSPVICWYPKNFSSLVHSLKSCNTSSKHTFPEISGDPVWGTV